MTTESIQLDVPSILYQQIVGTAKQKGREVQDVLLEAIHQVFGSIPHQSDIPTTSLVEENKPEILTVPSFFIHPRQVEMEAQVTAFEAIHEDLWASYPNQFIAMHDGTVVDHDDDESLLIQRIDESHPDDIVLVRQVQPEIPGTLVVRSPRLITSVDENFIKSQG